MTLIPCITFHLCREVCCEGLEICQLLANIYVWTVQQDREDGLSCTGIVDDLAGKEDLPMIIGFCCTVILLVPPFEEEDESIDWPAGRASTSKPPYRRFYRFAAIKIPAGTSPPQAVQQIFVQRIQLFHLRAFGLTSVTQCQSYFGC